MNYYARELLYTVRLIRHQIKWRKVNKHNDTVINTIINNDRVKVGKQTYGKLNVYAYNNTGSSRLVIGHYCSISSTSVFMLGGGHDFQHISTFPFKKKLLNIDESIEKGDIIIEDDVWIGEKAMIMSGVHIGKGAVIGACAVVSRDVPDYAVVAGIPAKILRYRFDDSLIKKLKEIDYSVLDETWVKKHIDLFYRDVDLELVEKIKKEGSGI